MTMAKVSIAELAAVIGKQRKLVPKDVEKFISTMFLVINEGLNADKQVKVKGLGTFKVTSVKPRESVNVNTGERVVIEGHDKVSFTPDAVMRDLVNKPFAQFETVVLQDNVDFEDVEHGASVQEKVSDVLRKSNETAVNETTAIGEKTKSEQGAGESESGKGKEATLADSSYKGKPVSNNNTNMVVDTGKNALVEEDVIVNADDKNSDSIHEEHFEKDNEEAEICQDVNKHKSCRCLVVAMVTSVVCFVAGLVLGIFLSDTFMIKSDAKETNVKSLEKITKKSPEKKAKPADTLKTPVLEPQKAELDFDKMNSDPRVRIGAYRIVGVDTVITLKRGQTMKSYCNATLGAGMLCYFQVLNDTTELSEGDRMKVPKVKSKRSQ